MAADKTISEKSYQVLYGQEFNTGESSIHKKLESMIEDLKQNKCTNQGKVKLIKGNKGVKYFRAKLNNSDRLLFTTTNYNGQDAIILLELISNHDYGKSKYLNDGEKIKNTRILDVGGQKIPTIDIELRRSPKMHWLDKFLTFDTRQEDIVENLDGCYNLPLIVNGHASTGKTSVALEKLRKLEEQFEDGKILFITQSQNLLEKSKQLYQYEYWNGSKLMKNIPERIEFTFVHQFIMEKGAKIKRIGNLVEGKQPITRNAFFSWFRQQCEKGKFKKYKNQGDKIYEEFTAVIAGGNLATDGESKYIDLGLRESIFSKDERKKIYNFFQEYRKFIVNDSKYYDTSLIAGECLEMIDKLYDVIIIDEVQDLTKNTLNMILASLKDQFKNNFLLCGDVNQVIHPSFFSISKLKNFLAQNMLNNVLKICPLEENYRNSRNIINLANRILHLKNYCFASEDKCAPEKNAFFMKSATDKQGQVYFLTDKNVDQIENIAKNVKKSASWAVLVLQENYRQCAEQTFGNQHVFSVQEAKGLEYENVVLYMFDEVYNKIWDTVCTSKMSEDIRRTVDEIRSSFDQSKVIYSRVKDKKDRSFEENKFFINSLYVAITRATDKVFILSQTGSGIEHPFLEILKDEEKNSQTANIQVDESSPEKWMEEAIKLIDHGATRQGKNIAISLLSCGELCYVKIIALKLLEKQEVAYIEEIMNELKNRGCHDEFEELRELYFISKNCNLFDIISNDKIDEFKKRYPKLRHNRQKILNIAFKERSLKIANHLLGDFTPKIDKDLITDTKLLFQAVMYGFQHIISYLLACGADINARNKKGYTLLHEATIQGHEKIVEILLDGGANIHATNPQLIGPQRQEDHWWFLRHAGTDLGGNTALHLAALMNRIEICKLLLRRGANAKAYENRSFTPVQLAILHGHKNVVEYLLDYEHEADIETGDYLYLAAQEGHTHIAELFLKKRPQMNIDAKYQSLTPLLMAAQMGHTDMCKFLLKKGADINAREFRSYTPLVIAICMGHMDVVQICLDNGADVNTETHEGGTPLRMAIEVDRMDIARLLLERGADVNTRIKIRRECSALHVAVRQKRMHMAELLLDHGADIDIADNVRITPLHLAVIDGDWNMIKFLIDRGTNLGNQNGSNALFLAMRYGHSDIIELLLHHGAQKPREFVFETVNGELIKMFETNIRIDRIRDEILIHFLNLSQSKLTD